MKRRTYRRPRQQRGQGTIIGLIVAMAIIVILSAWLYPRYLKPGGVDGSVQSPIQEANDVACGTYYQQIGSAIVEYKDQHGTPPPTLDALRSEGVTRDMWDDPDCKFVYNPQTGMLGDKDVALPTTPTVSANQTPGTPGVPSGAPTQPTAPTPGQPNTNLYSKAGQAGSSENIPSGLLGGGN